MNYFFAPASQEHQKREKAKARELRQSQWWRQEVGKGICYHCGEKFRTSELTMDHLIPIARGGKSNKKNCVPSCKECNTKKGYKTRAELALDELNSAPSTPEENDSEE
jgi:5-methylcytosine-specific restriction protein A